MKQFVKSILIIPIICLIVLGSVWLFNKFSQPAKSAADDNVSGYAWSENIGWISFNGSNYGVNLDTNNGKFSGYAWSENIGWISFNESDTGAPPSNDPCADISCIAKVASPGQLGKSNVNIKGWARALAYGGGWDGWIRFDHGRADEVYINPDGEFHGYAWGGRDTNGQAGVVGWTSFKGANYGVIVVNLNHPPSASCNDNEVFIYCVDSRHPILSWSYSDPDGDEQQAYQIQIDDNSNFSSPIHDTGWIESSSNSFATTGINFDWNTRYYWQVRVRDTQGGESDWSSPFCSFTTPLHAYPEPDFSWQPSRPVPEEEVQFFDQTKYYNGTGTWSWTFQDADPNTSSEENPKTTFQSPGAKNVDLTVTDSAGYSCSCSDTVRVSLPLPKWKEIKPW